MKTQGWVIVGSILIGSALLIQGLAPGRRKHAQVTDHRIGENADGRDTREALLPPGIRVQEGNELFGRKLEHFDILEDMAIDGMRTRPDTGNQPTLLERIKKDALPNWASCVDLMEEAAALGLSPEEENKRTALKIYAETRVQETLLYIRAYEEKTDRYNAGIDSLHQVIAGERKRVAMEFPNQ